MKVVEQICNRVAIIADSNIVEVGAVDDVFLHPKTSAAKKLIFSNSDATEKFTGNGKYLRLVFDGDSTNRAIVAEMILKGGSPVNIVFADTKTIDGKVYGHLLLQLPDDPNAVGKMLDFLDAENITYSEEEYDV